MDGGQGGRGSKDGGRLRRTGRDLSPSLSLLSAQWVVGGRPPAQRVVSSVWSHSYSLGAISRRHKVLLLALPHPLLGKSSPAGKIIPSLANPPLSSLSHPFHLFSDLTIPPTSASSPLPNSPPSFGIRHYFQFFLRSSYLAARRME